MQKFLISSTDTYRVPTIDDVNTLYDELAKNPNFEIVSFQRKTKEIKEKGEVVEEYQVVTVKKKFNEEKDPYSTIQIKYGFDERDF